MDGWSVYLNESCLCAAVCHITLLNLVYSYGLCGWALYFKFVNVTTSKRGWTGWWVGKVSEPATGVRGCQPKWLTDPDAGDCLRMSTGETQTMCVPIPPVDFTPDSWRGGTGLTSVLFAFVEWCVCLRGYCCCDIVLCADPHGWPYVPVPMCLLGVHAQLPRHQLDLGTPSFCSERQLR